LAVVDPLLSSAKLNPLLPLIPRANVGANEFVSSPGAVAESDIKRRRDRAMGHLLW
jgi:hypothetical protein